MRRLVPLLWLAGCSQPTAWSETVLEIPADTAEVVAAVASLPDCEAVRRGGIVEWRAVITDCGTPAFRPPSGCAHPGEDPPRVEVVLRGSAWDPPRDSSVPTLAHELCHVCGYAGGESGEVQADACAMRALARRP